MRSKLFKCRGCKRDVPADTTNGCDDDMPNHCDDCWGKAHPELVPAGVATPGTYRGEGFAP